MESRANLHPPCIIVHGGAWAIPDSLKEPSINGVKKAAKTGYDRLIEVSKITDVEPYFEHCGYVPNELQFVNLVELKKMCPCGSCHCLYFLHTDLILWSLHLHSMQSMPPLFAGLMVLTGLMGRANSL